MVMIVVSIILTNERLSVLLKSKAELNSLGTLIAYIF